MSGRMSNPERADQVPQDQVLGSSGGRRAAPALDDAAYPHAADLLAAVIDHYLDSPEFNGVPVGESAGSHANASQLVRDGLVQLVTTSDYMNIHIRPWVKDDVERQATELLLVVSGDLSGCLYPTLLAMQAHAPTLTHSAPYRDRLTLGHGTLDLAFFDLAAIEGYVQDPELDFRPDDDGFRLASAHAMADLADAGEGIAFEAGYAYDHSVDYRGAEPIRRYWCAFLHDLESLPPKHQMRLSTYQRDSINLVPHPDWWNRNIGGRWLETIGPFTKILRELEAINDLWRIAFGDTLFRTVDRPRDWFWLTRPTTGAWNNFIHLTDKLLSDNLRHKGLDASCAPSTNNEGASLGTLARLEQLLLAHSSHADEDIRDVLQPLRDVRRERQKPAHEIKGTITDANVVNKQRDFVRDIAVSLYDVRVFVQTHPDIRDSGWEPPSDIDNWRWL